MANTFSALASVRVGSGGAASISFTSIPQTYTDLLVKISGRTSNAYFRDSVEVRPNDAITDLSGLFLIGQGTTVASGPQSAAYVEIEGDTATSSIFGDAELYIPNYTSSLTKTIAGQAATENNNAASNALWYNVSYWNNSSAITSLTLISATWLEYSIATLYGIKNS